MLVSILGSPDAMLRVILDKMTGSGLPHDLVCDHICYRVGTVDRYEALKAALSKIGRLISEVPINGRLISIFDLHEPYHFQGREIRCVELPAPKAGSDYPEGWEHAEFVTGMIPGQSARDSLKAFLARYPHLLTDTRAMMKDLNPEANIRVSPAYQFKLHPRPIWEVVALEDAHPQP